MRILKIAVGIVLVLWMTWISAMDEMAVRHAEDACTFSFLAAERVDATRGPPASCFFRTGLKQYVPTNLN
jgi:hypothetical protein